MYQSVTEEKITFVDKKFSKSSELYYLEPGLYRSITDIVESLKTLIQKRHKHGEKCITIKVSRRTQKVEVHPANEGSGLAFFSTDLGRIFGSNVANEFGVMLTRKGPQSPEFAYDIICIHYLIIYTDLIEYKIVVNTKAPLLRCFLFISKLLAGNIITTGQYMNYQRFRNLQFRLLLKKSFHSIQIDLRDTSGGNSPFLSVGVTRLVLLFKKVSNIHF